MFQNLDVSYGPENTIYMSVRECMTQTHMLDNRETL